MPARSRGEYTEFASLALAGPPVYRLACPEPRQRGHPLQGVGDDLVGRQPVDVLTGDTGVDGYLSAAALADAQAYRTNADVDFGERSRSHATIPPAKTVEVPGGRGLLADTREVRVIHDGRSGVVERPSLVAAIVAKWRAFAEIAVHRGDPDRHLRDAARLLTVVDPDAVAVTKGDRKHLRRLLAEMEARPELASGDGDLVMDTLLLLNGS